MHGDHSAYGKASEKQYKNNITILWKPFWYLGEEKSVLLPSPRKNEIDHTINFINWLIAPINLSGFGVMVLATSL